MPSESREQDFISHAQTSDDVWTLDVLRAGIERELEHLCRATRHSPSHKRGELLSTVSHSGIGNSNNLRRKPKCSLCFESHSNFVCERYTTVDTKRERIKEFNLRFKSLRINHLVTSYRVQNSCNKCSWRHHTTFCRQENSTTSFNGSNHSVENHDRRLDEGSLTTSTIAVQATTNEASFLSDTSVIPTTNISLICSKLQTDCEYIFENGAQKTHALNSFAANLDSITAGYRALALKGFNTSK